MKNDTCRAPSLARALDTHFVACAAAAAAAGLAGTAEGAVVYSGLVSQNYTRPNQGSSLGAFDSGGVEILLPEGTATAYSGSNPTFGADINIFTRSNGFQVSSSFSDTNARFAGIYPNASGGTSISKIAPGAAIGANLEFRGSGYFTRGYFLRNQTTSISGGPFDWGRADTNGLMGFSFELPGSSDKHYGWVRITTDTLRPVNNTYSNRLVGSITVVDFAYESSANTPIAAGVVPEATGPVALGLLALGAVGIRPSRRKSA